MKNLSTFEHFNYQDEETDLYAEVVFTGLAEQLTLEFTENFETLWSPETIDDTPTWRIFVDNNDGFDQLCDFLNKEIGARNYSAKIV